MKAKRKARIYRAELAGRADGNRSYYMFVAAYRPSGVIRVREILPPKRKKEKP